MDSTEIRHELGLSYLDLVEYLLKKYGPAEHDYFVNENCRSKNRKASRSAEGLICHHIDEDKAIMLSSPGYAAKNPFSYQKADRLVYCNILEHLILHMKIFLEPKNAKANKFELQGIGGATNFLCPQINDYYNGFDFKRPYEKKQLSLIEGCFDGYIEVLKYFLEEIETKLGFSALLWEPRLSKGFDGKIVDKIYKELSSSVV